jgi:hypothetical protein
MIKIRSDAVSYADGKLSCFASDIPLPVGDWPDELECLGGTFTRDKRLGGEETEGYSYRTDAGTIQLIVFND